MGPLVSALYHDYQKARLALGDLQTAGVPTDRITLAEGLAEGSGRLEIRARDEDQAINVQSFLEQDGAHSVQIRPGEDAEPLAEIPPVPFPAI